MKSCELIASDKSNVPRKLYFFLKSGFQVIALVILLKLMHSVVEETMQQTRHEARFHARKDKM